ncbi:MAG: hypothetical protein EBU12_10200 [Microbacteriaceae bacterium]|nr:hypothetical protein [Microbacteriaceae bacterium]
MYREKIINVQTGEETWRDYTPAEIAELEANQAKAQQALAEYEAKATARQAVLDKLGLTPDEAQALLGITEEEAKLLLS